MLPCRIFGCYKIRLKLSAVFRGPWTHVFVKYSSVFDTPNSCFRTFSLKIFRGPRTMLRLRRASYKIGTLWTQGLNFNSVFVGMCSLELVEVLDRPNSCFRIFSLKIFRGPRTHGCYFSNFQNCHNCYNCCHRDSYLVFFSTIATIATIVVIRSQLNLFQNCHNCDNCCHRDSYLFFSTIATIATIVSSGVNCILCFRIAIIANNYDLEGSIYILFSKLP